MKNSEEYSQKEIMKLIDKISFFDEFTEYEKKRLVAAGGTVLNFSPGVKIISEGEKDNCFYILYAGSVAIKKRDVHFSQLAKGEIFGEMAFLANTIRSTSVISQDKVVAFRIDQESMDRLNCEIREKIKDYCIKKLVKRINKLTERLRIRM